MIIHFAPGGRLGNQLFELAFIEGVRRPAERILCTRLGPGIKTLSGLRRYLNRDSRIAALAIDKLVEPIFRQVLVPRGLFASHVEKEDGTVASTRGLLPVTYVRGYFQAAEYPERLTAPPRLRRAHLEAARRALRAATGRTPLFVHVRRGDYLSYWVGDKLDPSLPLSYYSRARDCLLGQVADPFFFFLGDEPQWAECVFADLPHAAIRKRPAPEDLAIMSLCSGGVASNSTFAWWGAFLCRGGSPILAPTYWLGWKSRKWFPPRIASAHMEYLEVS